MKMKLSYTFGYNQVIALNKESNSSVFEHFLSAIYAHFMTKQRKIHIYNMPDHSKILPVER